MTPDPVEKPDNSDIAVNESGAFSGDEQAVYAPAQTSWQKRTDALIVIAVFVLGIYDVFAEWLGGNDATISVQLRKANAAYWGVAALFGLLVGHLFLPRYIDRSSIWPICKSLIAIFGGLLFAVVFFRQAVK